jgi:hypothetical protein
MTPIGRLAACRSLLSLSSNGEIPPASRPGCCPHLRRHTQRWRCRCDRKRGSRRRGRCRGRTRSRQRRSEIKGQLGVARRERPIWKRESSHSRDNVSLEETGGADERLHHPKLLRVKGSSSEDPCPPLAPKAAPVAMPRAARILLPSPLLRTSVAAGVCRAGPDGSGCDRRGTAVLGCRDASRPGRSVLVIVSPKWGHLMNMQASFCALLLAVTTGVLGCSTDLVRQDDAGVTGAAGICSPYAARN